MVRGRRCPRKVTLLRGGWDQCPPRWGCGRCGGEGEGPDLGGQEIVGGEKEALIASLILIDQTTDFRLTQWGKEINL